MIYYVRSAYGLNNPWFRRAKASGGPVLFLVAQGWYLWTVLKVRPRLPLAGSAALVLVGFATLSVPPYVALILVAATLTTLAILDRG